MDPSSIASACVSISDTITSIVRTLVTLPHNLLGIQQTVHSLIIELTELKSIADQLWTCVNKPDVAAAIQSIDLSDTGPNASLWIQILAITRSCAAMIQEYWTLVNGARVEGDGDQAMGRLAHELQATTHGTEHPNLRARSKVALSSLSLLVGTVTLSTRTIGTGDNQPADVAMQHALERLENDQNAWASALVLRMDALLLEVRARPPLVDVSSPVLDLPPAYAPRIAAPTQPVRASAVAPVRTDFSDMKKNVQSGLEQGRRIVASIASISGASAHRGSVITSVPQNSRATVANLLAFRPAEYEAISEEIVGTGQSIHGAPLPQSASASIESWIPSADPEIPDQEQARAHAKILIHQTKDAIEAREWRKAALSLQTFSDKYADAIDPKIMDNGDLHLPIRALTGLIKAFCNDWQGVYDDLEATLPWLDSQPEGGGVDEAMRAMHYGLLARACFYCKRLIDAERYAQQVLTFGKQTRGGHVNRMALERGYRLLVQIKDAQLSFSESSLYCSLLHELLDEHPRSEPLGVADLWTRHLEVRRLWKAGDIKTAVEMGLHFITRYLTHSIGPVHIHEHQYGLSSNLVHHGDMGLAASGRGYSFPHLLASDRKVDRWREISIMLSEGADINAKAFYSRWTPLHCAAASDSEMPLRTLCRQPGIDLDALDANGDSPIMLAVRGDHVLLVELLQAAGAYMYFTRTTDGEVYNPESTLGKGAFHPTPESVLGKGTFHVRQLAAALQHERSYNALLGGPGAPEQGAVQQIPSVDELDCLGVLDSLLRKLSVEPPADEA